MVKKVAYGIALPGEWGVATRRYLLLIRFVFFHRSVCVRHHLHSRRSQDDLCSTITVCGSSLTGPGAPIDVYMRLSGSEHLKAHSFVHWAVWLGTVAGCVTISFILAEAIPFFGALTSKHRIFFSRSNF